MSHELKWIKEEKNVLQWLTLETGEVVVAQPILSRRDGGWWSGQAKWGCGG
jgi:hypothetical protein